jgi:hypothetical protein
MKNKRKSKLAELREGRPILKHGHPAKWLVEAIGQEAADAAVLFEALTVEAEGVVWRLGDEAMKVALTNPPAPMSPHAA